jgi:AraC-like DNA-binding protein
MNLYAKDLDQTAAEASSGQPVLLYARKYVYDKTWHSYLHTHNHIEIFYITEGSGSFQFSRSSRRAVPDDFFIINANVPHTEISDKDSALGYIVLGVSGPEALYSSNNEEDYLLFRSSENKKMIPPILDNILYEMEHQQEHYMAICSNLLNVLLLYFLRQTQHARLSPHNDSDSHKECTAVRRYIDTNYKENLTLDDLANYCHISKYYMIRVFKQHYGVTPMNYLQYRRIEESKQLLRETNLTASQIAHTLGFSSASHYSQCFKRYTSTSPIEFRKMIRELLKV